MKEVQIIIPILDAVLHIPCMQREEEMAAALREGEVARQRRWRGAARVLGRVAARAPSTRG